MRLLAKSFESRATAVAFALLFTAILLAVGVRDEVPLGGLHGVVAMSTNGNPLPNATVVLRPQFEASDWHTGTRIVAVDDSGEFRLNNIPAGGYTIEAYSKAHSMPETRISLEEGKVTPINLELTPNPAELTMYTSQHVFTPDEEPAVQLKGFGLDEKLTMKVYKVSFDRMVAQGGLEQVLWSAYRWGAGVDIQDSSVFVPVASYDHEIIRRDAEGIFIEDVSLPQYEQGMYWIRAETSERSAGDWIAVSDMAMIVKQTPERLLCYVTDIVTGNPVEGARVTLHQGQFRQDLGISGSNGLVSATTPGGLAEGRAAVIASRNDSRAMVGFYQYRGEGGESAIRMFVQTDRPVYRPGQEVSYKGIARRLAGSDYEVPAGAQVSVEIRDPDETLISSQTLTTNSMGTFSGNFSLNSEALTGPYAIECRIGASEHVKHVPVSSYRKPEYTVRVTPERPYYVRGDRVRMTVQSEYYFGGPVVGASVTGHVYRRPHWEYFGDDENYEYYEDESGAGEFVGTAEAVTDRQGKAVLQIDTRSQSFDAENDYIYTFTADVADSGGQFYSGSGQVKVARGDFALQVDTQSYIINPGERVEVTVLAMDHSGKPVANAIVRLSSGYERWTEHESTIDVIQTETVRTGADGKAELAVSVPRAGYFVVEAAARDGRRNEVKARQYVYATGDFQFGAGRGEVQLTLDRKTYDVGDSARLMIASDGAGPVALVTIEGDDIYRAELVRLRQSATLHDVQVIADHAPNAFVSVAFVSNKKLYEVSRRLEVDLTESRLNVQITSDKSAYLPGETAIYRVRTTDDEGRPVPAEIALGVVDEAIYAIREDRDDIIAEFYPKRYHAVTTLYSFPEIYLGDGDKDAVSSDVRERFRDTAFWNAAVMTAEDGTATVEVELPDNTTTWRATATGITADTRVGRGVHKVIARKPVMVTLQTPRFMTQKDRVRVSATIHNSTGQRQRVTLALQALGVAVEGSASRTINVNSGRPETIEWYVIAQSVGEAVFTAQANSAGGRDAVRRRIPVQPYGRLIVENRTGDVRQQPSIRIAVQEGYISNSGSLKLTLSPGIASSLLNSLDYMVGFPYGCTEQTMSRFMPTAIVAGALKESVRPEIRAQLPEMVLAGFSRLRQMQHTDGGWGWWEYDDSSPWMTAYVLEGYYRAEQAGYSPPEYSRGRALDWARNYVEEAEKQNKLQQASEEDLFLLRALALNGETAFVADKVRAVDLNRVIEPLQAAHLVITYNTLGESYAARRAEALSRLIAMAQAGPSRTAWNEQHYGVETTAQAVLAIATADPQNPILGNAIRWVIMQRRGDRWFSTRDTAFVLLGLTRYLAAHQESHPDYTLDVMLNGELYRSLRITPDQWAADTKLEIPFERLRAGDNRVEFRLAGSGNCYYSIEARQVVDRGPLGQSLSGEELRIERKYYRLEGRRLEDGTMRLMPSRSSINRISAGELIRCIVTVNSGSARQFMMIEEPIPAGCEITDRELAEDIYSWRNWWSRTDIRDNRIVFFMRDLPAGTHTIEYTMRGEAPGNTRALPSVLMNMYDPDVRASSAESTLEVQP